MSNIYITAGTTQTALAVGNGVHAEILAGGRTVNTTVSGGWLQVDPGASANSTTVSAGFLLVSAGGIADIVIDDGGGVFTRGAVFNTVLNSGFEVISRGGSAVNTIIGGTAVEQVVYAGGVAENTVVGGGDQQILLSGAMAINTVVSNGGTLVASAGATISAATLAVGGLLDLQGLPFVAGGTATLNPANGLLTVVEGGRTQMLSLAGSYGADGFSLARDAAGGTLIAVAQPNTSAFTATATGTATTITLTPPGLPVATVTVTPSGNNVTSNVTISGFDRFATQVVPGANGSVALVLDSETINLTNVAQISFIDGLISYDFTSPAAQIERLYQAALGRPPDPDGLSGWFGALAQGTSLVTIAAGFINSAEFQVRYPGVSQNPTAFITQLYANVLGRAPDAAGLANWVNALAAGAQSQAQVLAGFSESAENVGNNLPQDKAGIWVTNESADQVARLYYAALDRAPDLNGLTGWTSALQTGAETLAQVAAGFVNSPEFQADYGSLSNQSFVDLLYQNVLGRAADPTGEGNWTNALTAGAISRPNVLLGFTQSQEDLNLLAPVIQNNGIKLA